MKSPIAMDKVSPELKFWQPDNSSSGNRYFIKYTNSPIQIQPKE